MDIEFQASSQKGDPKEVDSTKYVDAAELQREKIESYKEREGYMIDLLTSYAFGNRFLHREAYDLCAIGETWPDCCYNPNDRDLILKSEQIDSLLKGEGEIHQRFEEYVDKNRADVSRNAAKAMSIDWNKVTSYRDSSSSGM